MAAGTGIGEFYVSLLVDAANGEVTVRDMASSFGALELATVAEIAALWELGVRLAAVVDSNVQASLAFEQFTMHTGLSARELQKWQIIAQQSHASADEVSKTVEDLTKHLAKLAVGEDMGAVNALQQLGISAFGAGGKLKDAFQILDEIRHRLSQVTTDAAQQERILSGLGISPNLRETLLLTDQMFNRRAALVPGMSAGQEKSLDRLRETLVEIELKTKQIGINLSADFAPGLAEAAKFTYRIFQDFVLIGQEVAKIGKFLGIGDLFSIIGAGYKTSADLLDVVAGKGLNVADVEKQSAAIGAALLDLKDKWGPVTLGAEHLFAAPPSTVTVHKQDTYHIHDAADPKKVVDVIDRHWDDLMRRKTIDGFDRQNGNGGF